jgi:NADH:ubiquinone oxidoreductase subunit 4 (subunit M)
VLIFWIGLYPQTFFNLIEPAAKALTGAVFLPVPIP